MDYHDDYILVGLLHGHPMMQVDVKHIIEHR
jgi:hypothetical protein